VAIASVRIPHTVVYRKRDDAIVTMSLASGEYAALEHVGARIWTLAAEMGSVDRICAALATEYDITPADCRDDVVAFLDDLSRKQLVDVIAHD
jgi:hypothetical protein